MGVIIAADEPIVVAATEAIRGGDIHRLKRLLDDHPELVTARVGSDCAGAMTRTLLHVERLRAACAKSAAELG